MAHADSAGRWEDAARGRDARSPAEIPKRGWRDVALRVKERMSRDRLSIIAAGVAFYALMAVFPALAALVAIYGLAFDPQQVSAQVAWLGSALPKEAADILVGQLKDLVQTDSTALGIGAVVGVLLAVWSTSSGVRTVMDALNVAYDEEERRGTIKFYAIALFLTLAALAGMAILIALIVAIPVGAKFLGLGPAAELAASIVRWPIVALWVMFGLAVLYRFGPSRRQPRWAWVSHGAVIATVLWLVGSVLFSIYVTYFASYNKTYGSAGAVVILLTWFLLSSYVVLIGAEINAESERQTRRDTTIGGQRPLGERGAHAADTVGRTP